MFHPTVYSIEILAPKIFFMRKTLVGV